MRIVSVVIILLAFFCFLFAFPISNAGLLESEVKGEIKVGNIVTFGRYYNHNAMELESLQWRILSVGSTKTLLITENCMSPCIFIMNSQRLTGSIATFASG